MIIERPKSFIPVEDQGYIIITVQTPDGTTQEPTSRVMDRVEQIALEDWRAWPTRSGSTA